MARTHLDELRQAGVPVTIFLKNGKCLRFKYIKSFNPFVVTGELYTKTMLSIHMSEIWGYAEGHLTWNDLPFK